MAIERDTRTGRWRFRSWVRFPDGRRDRVFGTPGVAGLYQDLPNSKAGATAADIRAKAAALHGKAPTPTINQWKGVPTLKDFSKTFLTGYLPGQKPGELRSKRQILSGHLLPAFGTMRIDEIRQHDVDAFATGELRRVCRKTVNNRLAVLSTLLRYAHECGLIKEPTLRCFVTGGVRVKDAVIVAVSAAGVARLLEAAATADSLRVAVLLATEAGLRIGEIRGLQWGDIKGGVLRVNRAIDTDGNVGMPKHDKRRDVPVSPALAAALAATRRRGLWVVSTSDGGMLGYYAALDGLHRLYDAAGVPVPASEAGVTMPWHSLRHTFGTECAGRGVPLATLRDLMGHEKIETTLRYVTVNQQQKRDAIELAFGRATVEPPTPSDSNQQGEKKSDPNGI